VNELLVPVCPWLSLAVITTLFAVRDELHAARSTHRSGIALVLEGVEFVNGPPFRSP
jgi:hypothetical protein